MNLKVATSSGDVDFDVRHPGDRAPLTDKQIQDFANGLAVIYTI